MANSNEGFGPGGGPSDEGSHRQGRIIDVEAVEITPETPASASPEFGAAADTQAPRSPWWPMIGAGAFGGALAIMAGAAAWTLTAPGGDAGSDELRARIASLELQQAAARSPKAAPDQAVKLDAKVDDLAWRLSKLETAGAGVPAEFAPNSALANRLTATETSLNSTVQQIAELDRSVRDNATAARRAGERAEAVASLLAAQKKADVDQAQRQRTERSALDGLTARIEAQDAALRAMEVQFGRFASTAPDKPLRVAVIATALRTAVERNYPFVTELAAARTLGLEPDALAALEPFAATGVPNANELLRELATLVPEMLRVSAPAGQEGNYLERLQANAAKLMNIRPVGDIPGDDPATVIGRIELKMVRPDIAGVLAELDKLPAAAQEVAQPWRNKALARETAVKSARQLETGSIAKLEEPPARDVSAP